jgi:hypothetical protein
MILSWWLVSLVLIHGCSQGYFSFEKGSGTQRVTSIRSERGDVSFPNARKKVPERRPSLRSSDKDLPERRSGALHHKNTPGYSNK